MVATHAVYPIVSPGGAVDLCRCLIGRQPAAACTPADRCQGGPPRERLVIYELDAGAFTGPGTWQAAWRSRLPSAILVSHALKSCRPRSSPAAGSDAGCDGAPVSLSQRGYLGSAGRPAPTRLYGFGRTTCVGSPIECAVVGIEAIGDVVYNHVGAGGTRRISRLSRASGLRSKSDGKNRQTCAPHPTLGAPTLGAPTLGAPGPGVQWAFQWAFRRAGRFTERR